MNALRHALLLLLMLILPLQGVAGVSMGMCASGMGGTSDGVQLMNHDGMTCHHAGMGMDTSDPAAPQEPAPSGDCPHCFALAHFIALPAPTLPEAVIVAAPIPFTGAHFTSLIPERPIRPPRLRLNC
ncbi:MAG: hypothetical protein FNT29_07625 [Halothiobacillaceae bacterium]|nr:MAG: hypothetical protein FNT29_07625 [Halothiobacillaceae bacterium]